MQNEDQKRNDKKGKKERKKVKEQQPQNHSTHTHAHIHTHTHTHTHTPSLPSVHGLQALEGGRRRGQADGGQVELLAALGLANQTQHVAQLAVVELAACERGVRIRGFGLQERGREGDR